MNEQEEFEFRLRLEQEQAPSQAEEPGILKNIGKSLVKEGPEIVGSMVGEAMGVPLGPKGMIAGAAAGAATGEAFKQIGQHVGQAFGMETDAPRTSSEAATRIGADAALGAAGSVGGQVLAKVARTAIAPLKSSLVANYRKMKDIFASVGGRLTPGQATKETGIGNIIDFVEEATQGAVFGGGTVKAFKEKQQQQVVKLAANTVKGITKQLENLGDDEIGQFYVGAIESGEAAHKAAASAMYTELDDMLKATKVSTLDLKKFAQQQLPELTPGLKKEAIKQAKSLEKLTSSPEAVDALRSIGQLNDKLSFTQMHSIRSGLLSKIRDLSATEGKEQAVRQLGEIVGVIDNAMDTGARNLSGEAADLWRNTNKFYREGKEVFGNELIAKMFNNPRLDKAKVGEQLFSRGKVESVRAAKEALQYAAKHDKSIKPDLVWNQLKSGHLRALIKPTTDNEIVGTQILKQLKDPKQLRTMREIYSPRELVQLKQLGEVAQLTQKQLNSGGGLAVKFMQFTQMGGLALGAASPFLPEDSVGKKLSLGTAGVFLLGPVATAKILTHPRGIQWLTEGLKANLTGKVPANLIRTTGFVLKDTLFGTSEEE